MGIPYEEFLRRFQATIADLPHAEQLQAMEDLAAVSLKGLPKEYLQALRRRLAKELDRPHGHGEQGCGGIWSTSSTATSRFGVWGSSRSLPGSSRRAGLARASASTGGNS
jgi:hypothetical protein